MTSSCASVRPGSSVVCVSVVELSSAVEESCCSGLLSRSRVEGDGEEFITIVIGVDL